MADHRSFAGEAGGSNFKHSESVEGALRHLEAAIARIAASADERARSLPGGDDLFSPAVQHHELDRALKEHAALKERHAVLSRQHDQLQQAHEVLLSRQAEAHARLGAVLERLRQVLPEVADEIADGSPDDEEDGA